MIRQTNITAEMVRAAAHYGRFGDGNDPAQVVCDGLVQIAGGFRTGFTVTSILKDMGLVGMRSGELTKKGKLFLYDLASGRDYVSVLNEKVKP